MITGRIAELITDLDAAEMRKLEGKTSRHSKSHHKHQPTQVEKLRPQGNHRRVVKL